MAVPAPVCRSAPSHPDVRHVIRARALRGLADGFVRVVLAADLDALGFEIGAILTAMLAGSAALTLGVGLRGGPLPARAVLLAACGLRAATGLGRQPRRHGARSLAAHGAEARLALQSRLVRQRPRRAVAARALAAAPFRPVARGHGHGLFCAGLLSAFGQLLSAPLARRIGLVRTRVYTHIPASVLLAQMDVPARQSLVMSLVPPEEPVRLTARRRGRAEDRVGPAAARAVPGRGADPAPLR